MRLATTTLTAAAVAALLNGCVRRAPQQSLEFAGPFQHWFRGDFPPGFGCRGPQFQRFGFWVGEWTVRGASGRDAGRSSIQSVLGGCAINEVFGVTGRSISAWRTSSSEWIQTYVDNSGLTLRLAGRSTPDSMILADSVRRLASTPPMELASRFIWTRLADGKVRQVWLFSRDGGKTWPVNFDGVYSPSAPVAGTPRDTSASSPAPAAQPRPCIDRPAYRALDGLRGSWSVTSGDNTALGTSTITPILDGCALEERFEAKSWNVRVSLIALDRYVDEWIWASADASGNVERFVAAGRGGSSNLAFVNEVAGRHGVCITKVGTDDNHFVLSPSCAMDGSPGERISYRRIQVNRF